MAEAKEWEELPDNTLVKEKLPCGCWSYFQQGKDYAVYTLIVYHKCGAQHIQNVQASPEPTTPGEPIKVVRKVTESTEEVPLHTPETPQLGGSRRN